MVIRFLYNLLLLPAALALLYTVGLLPVRIRRNLLARHGSLRRLKADLQRRPLPSKSLGRPRVWLHCASMGEYEAIRPLALALREAGCGLVLSFFSISGMRHLPEDHEFDAVCYMPLDLPWLVGPLAETIDTDVYIVTKHDLWWNLLHRLKARGTRLLFINANFHRKAHFDRPLLRSFYRGLLELFEGIHPVSEGAAGRFRALLEGRPAAARVTPLGETRYDRVLQRLKSRDTREILPAAFRDCARLTVAGSSWQLDEEALLPAWAEQHRRNSGCRLLLVPHEPTAAHLEHSEKLLDGLGLAHRRLSASMPADGEEPPVLLVDRVGVLAGLYRGALAAYVGGGFTTGVHSVIEPAAFGVPVCFGPGHHVSQEASHLLEAGAARETPDRESMEAWLRLLHEDEAARRAAGEAASRVVHHFAGATERILRVVLDDA